MKKLFPLFVLACIVAVMGISPSTQPKPTAAIAATNTKAGDGAEPVVAEAPLAQNH